MPRKVRLPHPSEPGALKPIRVKELLLHAIRREYPKLPAEQLDRYLDQAEYLLSHYLRRLEQGAAPTAKQHAVLLQHVIDSGTEFIRSLQCLPGATEFQLLGRGNAETEQGFDDNYKRLMDVCAGVAWIERRAKRAIGDARQIEAASKRAMRKDPKSHIARKPETAHLVDELVRVYEATFGKAATNSMHLGAGVYASRSVSEAGRLITLLVRLVDPSVSPQTIASCLSRTVQQRRRGTAGSRLTREEPDPPAAGSNKISSPAEG